MAAAAAAAADQVWLNDRFGDETVMIRTSSSLLSFVLWKLQHQTVCWRLPEVSWESNTSPTSDPRPVRTQSGCICAAGETQTTNPEISFITVFDCLFFFTVLDPNRESGPPAALCLICVKAIWFLFFYFNNTQVIKVSSAVKSCLSLELIGSVVNASLQCLCAVTDVEGVPAASSSLLGHTVMFSEQ